MVQLSTWLLDEDNALRQKLSGWSITNYATGQPLSIPVFYRGPDAEEVTRVFPHVSIDLIDVVFDPTRAHRANGYIQPIDTEQATPASGYTLVADDMPLPWSLMYQLSAYSRNPQHDRQLSQMFYLMFPEEFGSLDMTNFDGTVRRADLVSVIRRDMFPDSTTKRVFRNMFTIAVSSEFYLSTINQIKNVLEINVDIDFTGYSAQVS
jgi:hypothetical protein